jgi:hypothetical protein
MGHLAPGFLDGGVSETQDKTDPSRMRGKGTPLPSEPQRHRENADTPETTKGETAKGPQEGYVDSPKNVWC